MKNFVGIDLGTTNSAICSYDGTNTRIWKSPEQNDVTPSAIYIGRIGRRENKYFGQRAYDAAPRSPGNAATLFKRFMGTNTQVEFSAAGVTLTPEECSAEILKVLFGYLPEEIRNDPDTGTVITVPAAFNEMQKDATEKAATMSGIGKVALMQEPVAAVMSVMRSRKTDGMFLIYDIGGGTTDIAIAESIGGRVNLLAHGGIQMCGGRDFDRSLVDNVVRPWLLETFNLPEDFSVNPTFKSLNRLAAWVAERAKIELSSREEAVIRLDEMEAQTQDLNGDEIYLDIPLRRDDYTPLIVERVNETINAARETLSGAGLTPHDLECIVWVGGPTNGYKPLRDQVSFELGIPGDMAVNPMTAVAEGAGLFAESIDWSSQSRARKAIRGEISSHGQLNVTFRYTARTPTDTAHIGIQLEGQAAPGCEFEIDNVETGWTSGRLRLKHGVTVEVALTKDGENTFRVSAFDPIGEPISLDQNEIVITKTAAVVDAIPASHSIALEVLDKINGRSVPYWMVRKGDSLPKKGKVVVKAIESLKTGSSDSLNFKLWEGEIEAPITDNRFIGKLPITGEDFDYGVISIGAELECEYEIWDSGNLYIEVSVPSIGATFNSDKNFYSANDGKIDLASVSDRKEIADEVAETMNRIDEVREAVDDPKLDRVRQRLLTAVALNPDETDAENVQEANESVLEAKRILDQVREDSPQGEFRQVELTRVVSSFEHVRQYARCISSGIAAPADTRFDKLTETAQHVIDNNDSDFEEYLAELRKKNSNLHWSQPWFLIEQFKHLSRSPQRVADKDKERFEELVAIGSKFLPKDISPDGKGTAFIDPEITKSLRPVVLEMWWLQHNNRSDKPMDDEPPNIISG